MNPTSRKLKFGTTTGGVLTLAAQDIYQVLAWVAAEQGVPDEISTALARIGTAAVIWGPSLIVGWFTREH